MATPESNNRSSLDRFLGIFAEVHSGEGLTALLLALNVFLILMAYYILKPVREALILGEGSAELKTYMSAGQVIVLAFVVPLYAKLVASRPRMRLINTVTAFFTACLVVFYFLAQIGVPLGHPLLHLDRRLLVDDCRAVLVVRQRHLRQVGRRAAVRDRRLRRLARRRRSAPASRTG